MTLVLGAHHVCAAPQAVSISTPVGLVVTLSGIPAWIGTDTGAPTEYHHLGRVNLGNSLGYQPHINLVVTPQLLYPIPDEMTLCSINFASGAAATIDEIVSSASLPTKQQPFDRSATLFQESVRTPSIGGTALTTVWTYTVPAGSILMLAQLSVKLQRTAANTAQGIVTGYINLSGNHLLDTNIFTNTVGATDEDELAGGPLYLPAGAIISATYSNSDTGGQVNIYHMAAGLLFAA